MKARHFILMFVALLSTVTNVVAQGQQDAFFIYRNDGDFNAFHFHDVDSITYTDVKVVGQDSVFCDHIVAQLIWTQDSVYRIPIEAVDSVGFTTLETIINKDSKMEIVDFDRCFNRVFMFLPPFLLYIRNFIYLFI
jgi:hypothetical protein